MAAYGPGLLAHHVAHRGNIQPEQLGQPVRHRGQTVLLDHLALGTAQVGGQDQSGTPVEQLLQGGQRGADAEVVGHPAAVQRYVEVHPDEDALATGTLVARQAATTRSADSLRITTSASLLATAMRTWSGLSKHHL